MQLIAALVVFVLTSWSQPSTTTPADDTTAWDKLHPASQKYLEKNAPFYFLDDSGRLWNRKIYMEDEVALATLSDRARESRLAARNSIDSPAWYCLDNADSISALPDFWWIVLTKLNNSVISKRQESIRESGAGVYLYFQVVDAVDHDEVLGILYKSGGEKIDSVMIGLDDWFGAEFGDVYPILYPLLIHSVGHTHGYWKDGEYFRYKLPRYEINVDPALDRMFPIRDPNTTNFPPLTPRQLAREIADRNLTSLPEWRARPKPNPEYTAWLKNKYKSGDGPVKHIYTWTKKPIKLRFVD